jgi:CDP-glycerol glycerophosphotransferase (TagB/SpsB family)
MFNIYNNLIEVLEYNHSFIHLFVKNMKAFKINFNDYIVNEPTLLFEYKIKDQLLLEYKSNNYYFYIYSLHNKVFFIKETKNQSLFKENDNKFSFIIKNYYKELYMEQIGVTRLVVMDKNRKLIVGIDNFLTTEPIDINLDCDLERKNVKSRFIVITKVKYNDYNLILTYDFSSKSFNVFKILLSVITDHSKLNVTIRNKNEIILETEFSNKSKIVNFKKINKLVPEKLFDKNIANKFKGQNILAIYAINSARYFVFLQRNGIFIAKSNPIRVTQHIANLRIFSTKNHFYIYGRFTHNAFNSFQKYEYLFVRNSDHKIAKFFRPFSRIKYLKRFGFFKIPISKLNIDDRIHHNLFVGNEERIIHNLFFKKNDDKVKTYIFKRQKDNVHIIRTNLQRNITTTTIPYSKEYSFVSGVKINLAKLVSKLFNNKSKNINLFFEKKSNKADESAFRVFEKVMDDKKINSKNYFILNQESSHYKDMKRKYGSHIIEKYSFKHYLSIFNANFLVSSELSNHVLNDRLFVDSLRNKIMSIPLIFLQHGIMFAKPVDNPMAFGFHKDKNQYNMYKSVISSELEAGEFYKMKYLPEDLLLTGLATFDHAKLDPNAEKVAFMPTYRYWEEGLIYNNEIEETTYYKTLMNVIGAFEKVGLVDKLLIVPHNKFSEHIYRNMPEYKHIISDNPSEALKISRIFITDYSSAIYDAQYRGAYPIFYWEEKDYLIKQYKAIPPVNESNVPGPVVYNVTDLVTMVKNVIANNYQIEEEYKEKYSKINKFNDNNNTNRIIEFLRSDGII